MELVRVSACPLSSKVMHGWWTAFVPMFFALALVLLGYGVLILAHRGLDWRRWRQGIFRLAEPVRMPSGYREAKQVSKVVQLAPGDMATVTTRAIVMDQDGRTWIEGNAKVNDSNWAIATIRMEERGVTLFLPPPEEWIYKFAPRKRFWMFSRYLPVVEIKQTSKAKVQEIA